MNDRSPYCEGFDPCPDIDLCMRLKRPVHGQNWTYYQTSQRHRDKWNSEAGRPLTRIAINTLLHLPVLPAREPCQFENPTITSYCALNITAEERAKRDVHVCDHPDHEFCSRAEVRRSKSVFDPEITACVNCEDYVARTIPQRVTWSYGVTTVPNRKNTYLPRTLLSLREAGFGEPVLFVDDCPDPQVYRDQFHLDVAARYPKLRIFGNWMLALWELYVRQPVASRYAIFQDDLVACKNLREYLESHYEPRTYQNLYTMPENDAIPTARPGWYRSNQLGKGAVALVFDRETCMTLLSASHMVKRVEDPRRGHEKVDGGVVESLHQAGWFELVHNPSLVQHVGDVSTHSMTKWPQAATFRGEEFDARELIGKHSG